MDSGETRGGNQRRGLRNEKIVQVGFMSNTLTENWRASWGLFQDTPGNRDKKKP